MSDVPCNGCTACCRHDRIVLHPERGDRVWDYLFELADGLTPVLKRHPDGSCIYLTETGCSIHGRAPIDCREFDCRVAWRDYMSIPRPIRRRLQRDFDRMGLFSKDVRDAAKARIHTL